MGLAYAFKSGGLPLDRMREALVEHGYLPEDATINDLAEAVHAAARGSHTYSDRADVESRLDRAEQQWMDTRDLSQALELTDDDLDAIGIDRFSADEQQIIVESYEDVAHVLADLYDEIDIESYDDVKNLIMEARNEVRQTLTAYDDAQEAGTASEAAAGEPAGEGAAGGGHTGGNQGEEAAGAGATVEDTADIPEHVVNAVAAPREVMTQVGTATKRQTKDTLNTFLGSGDLSLTNPIRLTTVEELHDIIKNGTLRPGKDFEGRSGISAQLVDGKKPIVAYGPNDRISAAIVFPEEAAIGTGMAPNEVTVSAKTDVATLRFVVDGFRELMTFDQLKEAVGEKQNENPRPYIVNGKDLEDLTDEEIAALPDVHVDHPVVAELKQGKAKSEQSQKTVQTGQQEVMSKADRYAAQIERQKGLLRKSERSLKTLNEMKNIPLVLEARVGQQEKITTIKQKISELEAKLHEEQESNKGEQRDSQPGETTQVTPQKAASLPSKSENTPGSIPMAVEKNDKESSTADVGAELWYNRRNHTGRGISWADVQDLNETMRVKEVTKPKVWPRPDYEQLVNDGLHPVFARILKNIYDGIATGPTVKSDESLQRYIITVNRVRDAVMEWMQDHEAQKRFADSMVEGARRMAAGSSGHRIALSELGKGDDFTKAFLEKLWPEEMKQPSYGRFGRGTEAHGDLVSIGGNRALKALQITSRDMSKFLKEVEGGWPGKREAWQVQGYSAQPSETLPIQKAHRYVTDNDGTRQTQEVWYTRVAGSFPTLEKARAALTGKGAFLLLDKSDRIKGGFATREAAEAAARELATKKGDGGGRDLRGMNITDAKRRGPERRGTDENISSQRFMETFGFKGVNFGRKGYINDSERQEYLNHAYDALVDLAEIVDVPIKAMSLNGELGIAFGAQGRGGSAAAHFVPGVNEINMTKTMGAGTLAHEWAHAVDHWFGVQAGLGKKEEPYLSEHVGFLKSAIDTTGIRPEIVQTFEKIVQTMTRRPMTEREWKMRQAAAINRSTKNVESWLKHARLQFEQLVKEDRETRLGEFDELSRRIVAGDLGDGYVKSGNLAFRPTVAALRNLFKDATGRLLDKQTSNAIQVWARAETTASEAKQAMPEHLPPVATDFERESLSMDKEKKGKKYWSTKTEMFARAFESFVSDKLAEGGLLNTFLTDAGLRAAMLNRENTGYVSPYPRNQERETINDAFRTLVGTIETRETEKGTVLYSTPGVHASTPAATIKSALKSTLELSRIPIRVVQSLSDLPQHIQADMRLWGIEAIDGVFDPRTNAMYLVSDFIPSVERARELLRHEWFHAGVADKELEALYRYYSQKDMARLQDIADERGFDLSERSGRLEAAGELAAQLAETNPRNLLLARIVARIKEWLRSLGLQLEIGQAEVARIIRDAIQRVQTGDKPMQGARTMAGSAYSAKPTITPTDGNIEYSAVDRGITDHAKAINAPAKVADMTRTLFEVTGQQIPQKLKASVGRFLSNPWFGSEGKPVRRMVVNLNIQRSHVRNEIISDLFRASEGYTGVEGLHNLLKKASKAELKQFNDLIKYGDRNDMAKTFTRDELYRGKTPFGKLSRTVVEAYKAFHEIVQATNRVRFERLSEIALLPYQRESWYHDLLDLLEARMHLDRDLSPADVAQLGKLLSSNRRRMSDQELFGDNNPTGKPVTQKVAEAYKKFMDQLEATSTPGLVRMAYKHITEYRGELDKLKNEWGRVQGYAPRMRKNGDWHVSVYEIEEDGSRKKVYMKPTLTEGQARRHVANVKANLAAYLKNTFDDAAQYEVEYERNPATPSELLSDRGSELAIEQLIMNAFDKASVFKTSAEDLASMKRAILDEVGKEIMAQGFGRHGISREKTQIEGYRDDDYVAVLKEFISGMAGWLAKMQYAVEVNREADRISTSNPDDKVWVHDYFKDSMKNSTYLDEVAATARSAGALYYLGFKVSSALLNAFQNYTVGQAMLAGMLKKAGRTGEPILMLAKAQRDMVGFAMGKHTLTDEEKDVLRQAVRQGTAHAQAVRYMSGLQEQGFGSSYKRVVEIGMTPFSWVEQYVNREPGVLAAYRAFKTTPAGEFDQAAFAKAEEFTNSAHFLMGNENLPEMVRKMGALGKTLYLFQGYTHNYLLAMANALKNGEFEVIARSLGAIAALGGVFALPGADELDQWISKWFGVSYKLKFKMWMRRHAREYGTPGEALEAFVNHGAPAVVGVDMSRAIGVNIPFVSDPDKTFGERMGGVWGGMVKKPVMAAQALGSGQYYRAIESIMPEFVANPLRAYRQATTGATTLSGKPILDETGHQMTYGAGDVAKKVLGFQPLEISERTEMKSAERSLTAVWNDERKDKLAALRVARTQEQLKKAIQDIIAWNQSLQRSQVRGLVTPIKSTSIQRARQFRPASSDRKDLRQYPCRHDDYAPDPDRGRDHLTLAG